MSSVQIVAAKQTQDGLKSKMPFFLPISGKLAIITLILLLSAAIPIAMMTTKLFLETSGKREEESNRSQASSRAAEINGLLSSYIDKLSIIGTLRLKEIVEGTSEQPAAASNVILQRDKEIISFQIMKRGLAGTPEITTKYVDLRYLKSYKAEANYLSQLNSQKPFPMELVFGGQPIMRNRSLAGGVPLFTMAVPVAKDSLGRVTHIAMADLPLSVLQRGFSKVTERSVYLLDKDGNVLAHPNEKLVVEGANLGKLPIVRTAMAAKVAQGQLRYQIPQKKDFVIAAYYRCLFDLVVISEAPESVILEPAKMMRREVYRISGIVVSLGFFAIFIFAATLTKPIKRLVLIAGEVAQGNFTISATADVKSRDEVELLAWAFDGMTVGLRERDKVKNLFNKFHGSSITENLLESGDVALGGMKKQVCVFFSDIRGFTSFSESRTPEQVISMLNEYFTVMVKIINDNGGVVDKFIGDAIMAVWGAPKSTGDDSFNAVKASLEMRMGLHDLNEKRIARGEVPIKMGMGLHFGDAISGTVGSEARMEFTVIGDTVNLASRIEASTKAFGTDLLISDDLAKVIQGRVILEEAGSAEVKGKTEPLKFFKVRGFILPDGTNQVLRTEYSDYEAGDVEKVKVVK
jgi:adenylate cyclase